MQCYLSPPSLVFVCQTSSDGESELPRNTTIPNPHPTTRMYTNLLIIK